MVSRRYGLRTRDLNFSVVRSRTCWCQLLCARSSFDQILGVRQHNAQVHDNPRRIQLRHAPSVHEWPTGDSMDLVVEGNLNPERGGETDWGPGHDPTSSSLWIPSKCRCCIHRGGHQCLFLRSERGKESFFSERKKDRCGGHFFSEDMWWSLTVGAGYLIKKTKK